jgi:membrane protease YdiL (CAAX protease family)
MNLFRNIRGNIECVFHETENQAIACSATPEGRRQGLRNVAVVCLTAALGMTARFYGMNVLPIFEPLGSSLIERRLFWVGSILLTQLLFPILVVKFVMRERLRDYGLNCRLAMSELPMYLGLLVFVLGLVWLCSGLPSFQAKYPLFLPSAGKSFWLQFWLWEVVYLLSFIAVEFFFRGFLIHGLKQRFGFSAVFVAMMPYCQVHFGKPLLETLGSIVAGVALGFFSLKSRSILPGVIVHAGVALGMDLAVLWRKGLLF